MERISLIYDLVKKVAFLIDPEVAHDLTTFVFKSCPWAGNIFSFGRIDPFDERFRAKGNHINWPNPIGLAAGFDKNAACIPFLRHLGFGSIEVGTITPKPQTGNPKKRIFRLVEEKSLRNHMGLPNQGADKIYESLKANHESYVHCGVNLGNNLERENKDAHLDYEIGYRKFHELFEYLVINLSCPNVPGLSGLQEDKFLNKILTFLGDVRQQFPKPLFIKISPELAAGNTEKIVEVACKHGLAGIVATNTICMPKFGQGGISGKMLYPEAKKTRELVLKLTRDLPMDVIGVGGISCYQDLEEFVRAGGKFVQLYTAFIFEGPLVVFRILEDLAKKMEQMKVQSYEEYVQQIRGF